MLFRVHLEKTASSNALESTISIRPLPLGTPRSVLLVLAGLLGPIALGVDFHDDGVMHPSTNGRSRGHRVVEGMPVHIVPAAAWIGRVELWVPLGVAPLGGRFVLRNLRGQRAFDRRLVMDRAGEVVALPLCRPRGFKPRGLYNLI